MKTIFLSGAVALCVTALPFAAVAGSVPPGGPSAAPVIVLPPPPPAPVAAPAVVVPMG